jgi:hypothetical protein
MVLKCFIAFSMHSHFSEYSSYINVIWNPIIVYLFVTHQLITNTVILQEKEPKLLVVWALSFVIRYSEKS